MYALVVNNEQELLELAESKGLKIVPIDDFCISEKKQKSFKIYTFLISMGIKPHYDGFKYLLYILENNLDCEKKITKTLYPIVAKHFKTKPTNVERGIRNAIECALNDMDITEKYLELFGSFEDHPSNHQFLQGCKYYFSYLK